MMNIIAWLSIPSVSWIVLSCLAPSLALALDFDAYAKDCKAAIEGVDAIDFPDVLQCIDGALLPITRDGVVLPADTIADAANFGQGKDCDYPPALALGPDQGQCVPNSRLTIARVPQENTDEVDRPVFALLCRNYIYRPADLPSGKRNLNPEYDDIALIIHSPKNHNTCFFQRLSNTLSHARATTEIVEESITFPPVNSISGTDVPSPFSVDGEGFWASPAELRDNLVCSACHDANPFVRTPYIKQARTNLEVWFPTRKRGTPYHIAELDYFGKGWKDKHACFDLKPIGDGEIGRCTKCHSIGPGYSSGALTFWSTGEAAPNQFLPKDGAAAWRATHWMPPGANQANWQKVYWPSVETVRECNLNPFGPGCKTTPLHGPQNLSGSCPD
jgi:hypothetical protein